MKVIFLMGSDNDKDVVLKSQPFYEYFKIDVDFVVSSAHRNPEKTAKLAAEARQNGYSAIICAAGMAAHLAGMVASHSDLPVIGVPMPGGMMDGLDALLSTVQMPSGIPVATLAVGKAGAINSAVFCARMFAANDAKVLKQLKAFVANGCKLG